MIGLQSLHPVVQEDLFEIVSDEINWSCLENARILVSGAAGFLPSYMIYTILYLNDTRGLDCKIVGMVRNLKKARDRFGAILNRSDFSLVHADICDPMPDVGQFSHIIHAASQASPRFYGVDPVGTMKANILGTNQLLEAAVRWKSKRFLFFSSGEVYGSPLGVPTKEEDYGFLDILNYRSCYGESKRAGETLVASYWHQNEVPGTIVRPSHTYGPGLALDDGRVFADFVRDILSGNDIVLKSDGSAVRSFCYLADATRAFFKVFLEGSPGQAYNTGNPEGKISIKDLALLLVDLFPEKNLKAQFAKREADDYVVSPVPVGHPDVSKLMALGWKANHSLKSGFSRTVQSFLGR